MGTGLIRLMFIGFVHGVADVIVCVSQASDSTTSASAALHAGTGGLLASISLTFVPNAPHRNIFGRAYCPAPIEVLEPAE